MYALNLGDSLVADTHECDYPPAALRLPHVTSSVVDSERLTSREIDTAIRRALSNLSTIYLLDHDLLRQLQPDLILTQELCEVCAVSFDRVQQAARDVVPDADVMSLEPHSLADILESVQAVANRAGVQARGREVVTELQRRIDHVRQAGARSPSRPRVLALEWLDPVFVGGHWVPEMIDLAGGVDPVGTPGEASREVSWEEVAAVQPDIVVLMPCGFGIERTLSEFYGVPMPEEWTRLPAVANGQVYAVDGSSYFNRPGPRIVDGLEILARIIHPEIFGAPASREAVRLDPARSRA